MKRLLTASVALALLATAARAAEWKPAKNPLMTRWAKGVSPANAHPEYPRPQMVREKWRTLNGLWQLAIVENLDAVPAGKDLPESILVPFPVESALSGVRKRVTRVWYRRTFDVPADWTGQRLLLHFGAVDWEATVYVNAKKLGTHRGGYDAFSFDITDALKPTGEQELVVGVFDPTSSGSQPRGKQVNKLGRIWYTPSTGIWQSVWLEPVPAAHIGSLRIVPDIDKGEVRITVDAVGAQGCAIKADVKAQGFAGQAMAAGSNTLTLKMLGARLWSPDDPFLYDLKVSLVRNGQAVDSVDSYFGMRKVSLGKDKDGVLRLMLNNKFVFQIGFLDQGFWPDGLYTAPTDEALRYDIEVTRQLGMNLARKHVKIEPDRWYYWCDKLGLLVWQDMPNGNNRTPEARKQFEQELRALVQGRWNHPSIIMWVVFNEGWGQHDTPRYAKMVKEMDPTRLVNEASGWANKNSGDVRDVHKYPGPAAPKTEAARAIVLGEFGGLGLGVDGHTWAKKTWGYRGMASREELTRRYVGLLRKVWALSIRNGLSAAVYTQTSDVETECNGLMTYDRALIKVDVEQVAKANRGEFPPPPEIKVVVPTSEKQPQTWRYTTEKPPAAWSQPGFDDSGWKEGRGGFGTKATPGAVVGTRWASPDIWLRRELALTDTTFANLHLRIYHDEDAQVYLNGVLAARTRGFLTGYQEFAVSAKAKAALKKGKNTLAVHCRQTRGGQGIDVGLVDLVPARRKPK